MKIKLSEILQDTKTVAISGHIRPDGDCVGSCIGLYLYIQQEFPDVQPTVYLEEIRDSFKFLEGSDRIIHSCEEEKVYDLFIALDAGDKQRLGASAKYFDTAKRTVCIDHHISNPGYAQTRSAKISQRLFIWESPTIPVSSSIPAPLPKRCRLPEN